MLHIILNDGISSGMFRVRYLTFFFFFCVISDRHIFRQLAMLHIILRVYFHQSVDRSGKSSESF